MPTTQPAHGSSSVQLRLLYRFMASRQFVAGRSELRRAGFSATRIDSWLRTGRLVKIFRSVYAYGRDVEAPASVRRAALVLAGSDAALTGRTACEGWGMVRAKPGLPAKVEVGVSTGQIRKFKGVSPALARTTITVVKRKFAPGDVRMHEGLRLTSPAFALIDFAATATEREVRFAFLEACRLKLFARSDVNLCFARLNHRRGARTLRPLLALWVPELARIKSVLEGWFLLTWIEHGYPVPKVNEKIRGHEVDDHWPDYGFVLELDGGAFHSDPVQTRLDREKQRDLEARGLVVTRLTYKEFEADPDAAVDQIAQQAGMNRD